MKLQPTEGQHEGAHLPMCPHCGPSVETEPSPQPTEGICTSMGTARLRALIHQWCRDSMSSVVIAVKK